MHNGGNEMTPLDIKTAANEVIFLISFAWNIRNVKIFVAAWWMVEELDTQHRDMSKDNKPVLLIFTIYWK